MSKSIASKSTVRQSKIVIMTKEEETLRRLRVAVAKKRGTPDKADSKRQSMITKRETTDSKRESVIDKRKPMIDKREPIRNAYNERRPVRKAAVVSGEKTKAIIKHQNKSDDEFESKYDTLPGSAIGKNMSDYAMEVIKECAEFIEEEKNYCYLLRVTRPDRPSRPGEIFYKVGHTSTSDDRGFAARIVEHNSTFKCFIDHELLHIVVIALFESPTGKSDEKRLHDELERNGYRLCIQSEKAGSYHKETYELDPAVCMIFGTYAAEKKNVWFSKKYDAANDTWDGKPFPESCQAWFPCCGSDDEDDEDSDYE